MFVSKVIVLLYEIANYSSETNYNFSEKIISDIFIKN